MKSQTLGNIGKPQKGQAGQNQGEERILREKDKRQKKDFIHTGSKIGGTEYQYAGSI